jgi:predicted amidohydrolase YtcJ
MQEPTPRSRRRREVTGLPDLLLVNARVLTLEPGQPSAEAVAIRGGAIAAVGSGAEAASLVRPGVRTIDCRGMSLLPGLMDSHCHLLALAASWQVLDCSPPAVSSIEELQQAVRHRAETTTTDRWIRGSGYDDLSLSEGRHPSRWDLDQVAPHHPVRLDHRSGHATVLNSRALEIAGIDKSTPEPVEGVIDRDGATGEPTGLLLELAAFLRRRLGATGDQAEFEKGVLRLNDTLLGYGLTSVQDAGPDNGAARWETFRELQASGRLLCRVTMLAGASRLAELQAHGLAWGGGDDWLRLGHAKVMLTLTTGVLQPSMEVLRETVAQAHRAGFPVAIHAVEQEAVAAAAQALRETPPCPPLQRGDGRISASEPLLTHSLVPRDRIEHCAECPPELVDRVRSGGVTVVTQPGFVYWNGDGYLQRVEPSLLPHLYPVGALARASVPLAFGSDAPVIDPNPWPAIYSAVTRSTSGDNTLPPDGDGPGPRQGVSVGAALRMYTAGGAYAEGTESRKGTICRGKLADLTLLDGDPATTTPSQLKEIRAVLTIVGGQVVWDAGL